MCRYVFLHISVVWFGLSVNSTVVQVSHLVHPRHRRLTDASIVRSAIGDIPLCLGGEVDCVEGNTASPEVWIDTDEP